MKKITLSLLLVLYILPAVLAAVDFNQPLSPQEEQQINQILAPLAKAYSILKYVFTAVGVLAMVYAGISYVTASGEATRIEAAKNTAKGVVIGLTIIWGAPFIISLIFP